LAARTTTYESLSGTSYRKSEAFKTLTLLEGLILWRAGTWKPVKNSFLIQEEFRH